MTHDQAPVLLNIKENGIAFLTLNRPRAMNALNVESIGLLEDKFYQALNDPNVKSIAICGAGKPFAAGADIKFFIQNITAKKQNKILSFTRRASKLFLSIERSKKPTIALLNGFSLGGGSELALACQAIIATEKGSMGFPETAIGIFPGLGGMVRLAQKIGPALAKYYVFTGATISSLDALDLGLIEKIVPNAQLADAVENLAVPGTDTNSKVVFTSNHHKKMSALFSGRDLMTKFKTLNQNRALNEKTTNQALNMMEKNAPLALETANEIMDQQVGKTTGEALEMELSRIKKIFSTRDALEGLSSLGRRTPNFTGE